MYIVDRWYSRLTRECYVLVGCKKCNHKWEVRESDSSYGCPACKRREAAKVKSFVDNATLHLDSLTCET